ncbi:pyrimidine dimer DNA glycosylase/endonuclease V [Calditrichota bacterium]
MRLWSLHPCYLDAKGLVALWREGLLAQKVLQGRTKGYRNHPQLNRFKSTSDSVGAISTYLAEVVIEANARGYKFDASKLVKSNFTGKITVTNKQLDYEFQHLIGKLESRDPQRYELLKSKTIIRSHPLFSIIEGNIEDWEIT